MIYHILADGSKPKDITGHIVRLDNDETICRLLYNVGREKQKKSNT